MAREEIALVEEDKDQIPEFRPNRDTSDKFAGRVRRDGDRIVVTLDYPVKARFRRGGEEREETVKDITFRQPNGGDMRALASFRDEEEKAAQLLMRIGSIPGPVFDQMSMADIGFCGDAVADFLMPGLQTGKK